MYTDRHETVNIIFESCLAQTNSQTATSLRQSIGYKLDLNWRQNRAGNVLSEIGEAFSRKNLINIKTANEQGPIILNKQQPSLYETVSETTKRLTFMEQLTNNQPNSVEGIVMGGSLSYGRFVNVRGHYPNSSDLDLIFVYNRPPTTNQLRHVFPTSLGFSPPDIQTLLGRMQIYQNFIRHKIADMFSHKFIIPQVGFDVSTHFMSMETFYELLHPKATGNQPHHLLDYKAESFPHQIMKQKNMIGAETLFQVSEQPVQNGVITKLPVYKLDGNNFVPGIYHNLISPMFELFFGSNHIKNIIDEFRVFITLAAKINLATPSDISLSHPRKPLFSSYIISEINDQT